MRLVSHLFFCLVVYWVSNMPQFLVEKRAMYGGLSPSYATKSWLHCDSHLAMPPSWSIWILVCSNKTWIEWLYTVGCQYAKRPTEIMINIMLVIDFLRWKNSQNKKNKKFNKNKMEDGIRATVTELSWYIHISLEMPQVSYLLKKNQDKKTNANG